METEYEALKKKIDGNTHKFWYLGPMWRYERPQKGRYRQFNQAGVEILGYPEGVAELEIISLILSINTILNIEKSLIKINHLGNKDTKAKYCNALLEYLKAFVSQLDQLDQSRLKKNPLRILDSQNEKTKEILIDAPIIKDFLCNKSLKMLEKSLEDLKYNLFLESYSPTKVKQYKKRIKQINL